MTRVPIDVRAVEDFIYREAQLIDDRAFDAWFSLFTDDGIYWVPAARGQQDMETSVSLACEDTLLLRLRIDRLKHPRAYSQKLTSYSQHILQRPDARCLDMEDGRWQVRTPFMHVEVQGDRQIVLAGVAWHTLLQLEGVLKIKCKRIELLNCEAALPSIETFL